MREWHLTSGKDGVGAGTQGGPCKECQRPMIWVDLRSGTRLPLDAAEVVPQGRRGVIALDRESGLAWNLREVSEQHCAALAAADVTFHVAHFTVCEARREAA